MVSLCLLLFLAGVFAGRCERKLQNIVYSSGSCAEKYLEKISRDLKRQRKLLFTSQRQVVISSFEQKYGVHVKVTEPFTLFGTSRTETCFNYSANEVPTDIDDSYKTFTFPITESYLISSVSLYVNSYNFTPSVDTFGLNIYLIRPVADSKTVIWERCVNETSSDVLFTDSGEYELQELDCPGFSSGATYKPFEPISDLFVGYPMNSGFWAEVGANYFAPSGYLQNLTLILCTQQGEAASFNYGLARSVLNYPAFNFDSEAQLYLYTFTLENAFGQELTFTIETPAESINC